ncbi:RagB/SusD family nutrient uptake outer membrane protein [Psychroserpens sp. SPM9]|uniref:RagB/SusD family nutrient uptake outer membrane protein n=1 Tax=Psychroserpens sp. SPM9 TaxID=2975598 RepID=UPI0021A885D1|nr:RagB/SusD family nutrient uptake outer membrane protein [Psychroserpens sp. SPM9]MDG5490048.1 RagB/SusD family nutrient uptake outer membrane protein [Psychroserpens sp. SPM9]
MKKYILKTLSIAAVLFMVSCEDATEVVQEGELNEEVAFQTVADLQSGLNGAYAAYGPDFGGNGAGDAIYTNAILSDNIKAGQASNGQGAQDYSYFVDFGGGSPASAIWANRYATINRVNRVLRAMGNLTFTVPSEITEVNHIKGQLLALRALAHLDLFEYFTVDYQDSDALAVINVDFVPLTSDAFERNTVAETVAFINADLEEANSLIDPSNTTVSTPIYINNDVIKALQIKLAIDTGDFGNDVLTKANELLAAYPLANQAQYAAMFFDGDITEVIFKLARVNGDNGVGGLFYFNQVMPSDGFLEMSNQLLNELSELPNDIRRNVNLAPASTVVGLNDPANELLINKYPGGSGGLQVNDIKLIRSSEIQLIKAEIQARNGALGDAAQTVQDLRDMRTGAASPSTPYATLDEALVDILDERRKEFCFEGKRFLDLKRIGPDVGLGVSRLPVDCGSFNAPCNLAVNDFRFTLAIPQNELDGNNAISQNPGY